MRQPVLRDPPLQKQSYERKNRMKLLTSFLALTALSLATSAFAQDESPSPAAPADEKTSATIEASPEATRSPSTVELTPAATSSPAETKEQPSASATPGAKKKETAPSTESATKPGKKMSVEAAIKDNENKWEAAIASHDISFIQSVVADDFMGVYTDGKIQNKSAVIAQSKKDKDTYKSAKNEKLSVRTYGPNVAVVIGTSREKGTGKDGQAFDRTYRFTDTWVDRNGQWQCVAGQVMLVKK
jgi:ketosteroid isomerase-like protein